jgi:hypothetical protein
MVQRYSQLSTVPRLAELCHFMPAGPAGTLGASPWWIDSSMLASTVPFASSAVTWKGDAGLGVDDPGAQVRLLRPAVFVAVLDEGYLRHGQPDLAVHDHR